MPTFFKTSVEFPVGMGPTGGCAYCARAGTAQHRRQKAEGKRQKRKTCGRSPLPLFRRLPIKLVTLKLFKFPSAFLLLLLSFYFRLSCACCLARCCCR